MFAQAYFEDIQYYIKKELNNAKQSIKLAVAWFTDNELFSILLKKQKEGVNIQIILSDDEINKGHFGLNFKEFELCGGKVRFKGNKEYENSLMHNKFCIIDSSVVISGSYNWSKKAKNNNENITIFKENEDFINKFITEFNRLFYSTVNQNENFAKLFGRLETIKLVIKLEDNDDIQFQKQKLSIIIENLNDSEDLFLSCSQIIKYIENYKFSNALQLIDELLKKYSNLTVYEDPIIPALRLQLNYLKYQLLAIDDEIVDIEKMIRKFEERYDNELGQIILKILELKKEIFKKKSSINDFYKNQYYKSIEEFENLKNGVEKLKLNKITTLSEEEEFELKTLHRKAVMLCHPDKVPEEFKKQAQEIFVKLTDAYKENNINELKRILDNLKNTKWEIQDSENIEKINSIDLLKDELSKIEKKLTEKTEYLKEIKSQETYNKIVSIENWHDYFEKMNEILNKELEMLENENYRKLEILEF